MEINNSIKNNLLSLDDNTLKNVINSLTSAAGMDTSKIKISETDMQKIRNAIKNASNKDTAEALKLIGGEMNAKTIIEAAKRKTGHE